MKTLKLGSSGPEVKKLQIKLIEKGWLPAKVNSVKQDDGIFGPNTQKAVIAFQRANNLVVDGRVGTITWNALVGGSLPVESAPIPDGFAPALPSSYSQVKTVFGSTRDEIESLLAFCPVPSELSAFKYRGNSTQRGFTCHKLLVPLFKSIFQEIADKGLASKIYSYEGVYNWRQISGSSNMSLHSYAIAIDLNYEGNELGDRTPAMDKGVIKIFEAHKFYWGGKFSRPDGMHFEYYKR